MKRARAASRAQKLWRGLIVGTAPGSREPDESRQIASAQKIGSEKRRDPEPLVAAASRHEAGKRAVIYLRELRYCITRQLGFFDGKADLIGKLLPHRIVTRLRGRGQ